MKIINAILLTTVTISAYANVPVFDASNLVQNTITAEQMMVSVSNQVKAYKNQLEQYQEMIQNTVAPTAYIWDQANITINKLLQATDTLDYYKQQAGSIKNYLARYQDVNYYRDSPCFSASGCSSAQWQQLMHTQNDDSSAQKRANDAMLLDVDQQQNNLKSDATQLRLLQAQATTAKGRMQAIEAANQLASEQTNQLLQIRALLIAQQNAEATRAASVANHEAIQEAADKSFCEVHYVKSDTGNWSVN